MPEPAKKRLKKEQDIEEKPDLTAKLPDEILCHVLSFLPLRGKLRSEAVNHRFQRCILFLLNNKPQRLAMDFDGHGILNGHKVPMVEFANAVRSFAKKAKFTEVAMDNGIVHDVNIKQLNSFLSALITSKNHCLSSLTTFSSNRRCTNTVLEKLLAKCDKLSTLKLDVHLEGVTRKKNRRQFAPDLATALENKALAQLELGSLSNTSHPELLQFFCSIKPKTLKKLELKLFQSIDIVGLVNELGDSAWAALEEIRLIFYEVPIPYTQFILTLAQLPSLRRCQIKLTYCHPNKEFGAAMVSLFNNSINVAVNCFGYFFDYLRGCQIVAMIHQIQNIHPAEVVFYTDVLSGIHLVLKHGSVSFENNCFHHHHCIDNSCVQCHSFYPNVLGVLRTRAKQRLSAHLENYQLDQCRIDCVVEDIRQFYSADGKMWKAMAANTNEADGTVEITFGCTRGGQEQFNLSLGYGPCFSRSCIECTNVG